MSRKNEWNVVRTFSTEMSGWEVVLEVECKGYYDPGKTSGPPENCYPPEGEDERVVVSGKMREITYVKQWHDGKPVQRVKYGEWAPFSPQEYSLLGVLLHDEIMAMDLELHVS